MKEDIAAYLSKKKKWHIALQALVFAWFASFVFTFSPDKNNIVMLPFSSVNFIVHEGAHALLMPLPSILTASAGSMAELLFAAALIGTAVWQAAYGALPFTMLWMVLSSRSAGLYMADAQSQSLPLVSPFGENAMHDWHYVFEKLGWLQYDKLIGNLVMGMGLLFFAAAVAWYIYAFVMAGSPMNKVVNAADPIQSLQEKIAQIDYYGKEEKASNSVKDEAKNSIYPDVK